MSSYTHTMDFRDEFAAELGSLLRKRFMWFLGSVAVVWAVGGLVNFGPMALLALGVSPLPHAEAQLTSVIDTVRGRYFGLAALGLLLAADIAVFLWFARQALRRGADRAYMLDLSQQFLVYRGSVDILTSILLREAGFPWLLGFYHLLACALLPWSPKQALRPILPVVALNGVAVWIFAEHTPFWKGFIIVLSVFLAAPGLAIAWAKTHRRMEDFKMRFLQSRYGQMRRELVDARRIHESLFPAPLRDGPLALAYRYEPMRQIGGDYLYARFSPPELGRPPAFNVLLIDVTGHGIAAALTVNRLYGEVERLFAENPHTRPAEVLTALNRYVHLTLATHSVYATALCLRVDRAADTIEYASGGHPPAFLLGADGAVEELPSTAFVLGACAADDFDADPKRLRFGPGDALVAYTDGAIEARNPAGRMLGTAGLSRVLAGCDRKPDCIAQAILAAVESYREGPPKDDTLIVEICRSARDVGHGALPAEPAIVEPRVDGAARPRTIRAS